MVLWPTSTTGRVAQSALVVVIALQANLLVMNGSFSTGVAAFTNPVPIRHHSHLQIPSPFSSFSSTNNNNNNNNKFTSSGANGNSQRYFTSTPAVAMSSHAAENKTGGLMRSDGGTDATSNNNKNNNNDRARGGSSLIRKRNKLVTVMKATAEQGMKVVARRPDIEGGQRYRSKDWLINILSLPNSFVLKRIRFHLLTNVVMSALTVLVNRYWFRVEIPLVGHTLLGGFLGLLLVFRTDSAYSRFWEARKLWAETMSTCRSLAVVATTQLKFHSPVSATRLLELLIAFPEALAYTCLSGDIPLTPRLQRIVPSRMVNDPAMALCLMMQRQLLLAAEESPDSGVNIVEARYQMESSNHIQTLVDTITSCETIVRTPVPWSYSRHTSRFLTLWSGTLPLALVPIFGWLTLPVSTMVCWCLFGIEEIGHLIEQPFVSDDIVASNGYLSPSDRQELKAKAYDIGIPVEQLAYSISGQVIEIAHASGQLEDD